MAQVRTLARAGVGLLTVGLVAAACGGGGGSSNSGSSSSSSASSGDAAAYAVYQPSNKTGGTLQLLDTDDCDSWDPARTYYAHCWNLQRLISRTLVTYAAAPGNAGTKLVPDLATTVPTSPDGGYTWTYHLKDNIKFETGAEITSYDIKYAVERVFATGVINGGPTYVIDELANDGSYKGPYEDPNGLASIETPDAKTITFKLKEKFSDWNYVMAAPTDAPVPKALDTKDSYTNHPVASGPYKFASYQPGKELTLVRNPYWVRSSDPVRKALPDKVVITMGVEATDVDKRIIANQADSDDYQTGLQQANAITVERDPQLQKRTVNPTGPFLRYLTIFQANKPFNNIHCRLAVAYVVDRKAQQIARGGASGGGAIATTMLPPGIEYHQDFNLFPQAGDTGNVAMAKSELAQCGYPNGFSTRVTYRTNGKEPAQATALQADLAKIGIKAQLVPYSAGLYFSSEIGVPANVHKQGFGMGFAAWGPDWPAPYGYYHFIVDGRQILAQGNSNYGELNLASVNNGIDDAMKATTDAQRQADWLAVDKAVVGSAVYIPLLDDKYYLMHSSRATNVYVTNGYSGEFDFASMGVIP